MTKKPKISDVPIAIVGAGIAGLCMAMELKKAGIHSFVIYEAGPEVGGTWRVNTYPGCACDIPSHLYSFSFELNPNWSRAYSPQPEIQEYVVECAAKYELYSHIEFNIEIMGAQFDEDSGLWTLQSKGGESFEARAVILGVGGLSRPNIPRFEGLEEFRGAAFHSAEWDHDFDLSGKRVAVVGTGASAVQIVPSIADEVEELKVFQRTPPWILPRANKPYKKWVQKLFAAVPGLQRAYRSALYLRNESLAVGFLSEPRLVKPFQWAAQRYIRQCLDDEELIEQVTPDYTIGCKRVTFSNDYYPTLARDNVELVPEPVVRFTKKGVVSADEVEREIDAVVFATGFRAIDFLSHFQVLGRGGRDLNDEWRHGAEAYYGVAVTGFPNLFMIVGPNTGLGHNSIIFMIEAQVHLVRQCIEAMLEEGADTIEVRPSVHRDFNESLQERTKKTVWQSGCQSWYLEESGKNTTLWPGYTAEFWLRTRSLDRDDFRMTWR